MSDPSSLSPRREPPRPGIATLFLMVGLPGAGKTTRAGQLASEFHALRLTPDDWMISLFEGTQPEGRRDLLEGRLIDLALDALRLGTSVVLDFGLWGRDERSALRWLAGSLGMPSVVVYLPVDEHVQRARIARRQAIAAHTTFPRGRAVPPVGTGPGRDRAGAGRSPCVDVRLAGLAVVRERASRSAWAHPDPSTRAQALAEVEHLFGPARQTSQTIGGLVDPSGNRAAARQEELARAGGVRLRSSYAPTEREA